VIGALAGVGLMSYPLSMGLLILAAVLGNQTNYALGRWFGAKVYGWDDSRFFNKAAFDRAHDFYEKNGGVTLIAARFMPFVRTFAPFVAGVAQMSRAKFSMFDVTGAVLWVGSVISLGYFFGNLPWVKAHLSQIIWAMLIIPGLVILFSFIKNKRR